MPPMLALLVALLPFAGLIGPLVWMARALGERSIEDMTQDLLKGMLRSWLDAHLPGLVEKLVREEIERVARRGR